MKRILALLALIVMVISVVFVFSACDNTGSTSSATTTKPVTKKPSPSTPSTPEADDGERLIIKDGVSKYSIVYSQNISSEARQEVVRLRDTINELTNTTLKMSTDRLSTGETEYDMSTKEILVGDVNVPIVQELLKDMKYNDYKVLEVDKKIIIAAKSPEALAKAIDYFIEDTVSIFQRDEVTGKATLAFNLPTEYTHEYKVSSLKICGTDISKYKIVYGGWKTNVFAPIAEDLQKAIASTCGEILEISADTAEKSDYEIIVGKSNREVSSKYYSKEYTNLLLQCKIAVDSNSLFVGCGGEYSNTKLSEMIFEVFAELSGDVNLDSTFDNHFNYINETTERAEGTDIRIFSSNILAEMPSWDANGIGHPVEPRAEIFAAMVYNYMPDALGIQEVTADWKNAIERYLGDDYKLAVVYRADFGKNYTCIIYNTTKYNLIEEGHMIYSKHMQSDPVCRGIAWTVLENKTTKQVFTLMSTHWDFDNSNGVKTTQSSELVAKIAEVSKKYNNCPVVITGDFNSRVTDSAIISLIDNANLFNAATDAKQHYNDKLASIDFVFSTSNTEVLGYQLIVTGEASEMSDHKSVLADIKLK